MSDASTPLAHGRILVVDDQRNMRAVMAFMLRDAGYTVHEAATGEEALPFVEDVDLLLTDLKMEPLDGLSLLQRALAMKPGLRVIMVTAFGSIESAVEAMRRGANDYLTKPFKEDELLQRVKRALERSRPQAAVHMLPDGLDRQSSGSLLGTGPASRALIEKLLHVARSDATVLIQGESGTGKERVAHALHAFSQRKDHSFVPIHCAAVSERLLEDKLFSPSPGSSKKGAKAPKGFLQEAHQGTLFINEVAELSLSLQAKLLRALQPGEAFHEDASTARRADVRLIAATHRDLEQEVREGRFLPGLYHHLNVVPLRVPPLRERLEDVPALAEHLLGRINERLRARGDQPKRLSSVAVDHLTDYDYPGNVRELESLMERAVAQAMDEELRPEDFLLPSRREGRDSWSISVPRR